MHHSLIAVNAVLQVLGDHQRLTLIPYSLLRTLVMLSLIGVAVISLVRAGPTLDLRIAKTVQWWLLTKTRTVLPRQKTSSNGWEVCVVWPTMIPTC